MFPPTTGWSLKSDYLPVDDLAIVSTFKGTQYILHTWWLILMLINYELIAQARKNP